MQRRCNAAHPAGHRAPCAFLLLGVIALGSGLSLAVETPTDPPRAAVTRAPPLPVPRSPEVAEDGRVTFRIRAPGAREVAVVTPPMAISAALPPRLPMAQDGEGIWSVTTPPLPPDIYPYQFLLDGALIPDPSNPPLSTAVSQLSVPGQPWSGSGAPEGAVAKHTYASALIGGPETYYVYTPPGYEAHRHRPYPVLYVLHGLSNDGAKWIEQGGANRILDTLIAEGRVQPMILVSPTAYGNTAGIPGAARGFPIFTRALLEEILPAVEREYNASSRREDRAVTGLSMGAAQSLLLLNRPERFAWIGAFSPGFDMYDPNWSGQLFSGSADGQRPALRPMCLKRRSRRLRIIRMLESGCCISSAARQMITWR